MENFEDVFHQYAQPVYRFLLKLTGEEALAEELTQETFYQAFLHIDSFRGDCALYTWMCQIGKHAYHKELRRRGRQLPFSPAEGPPDGRGLENRSILQEQVSAILTAIQEIPEPYSEVLTLRLLGEQKFREIGLILGRTENWAKVTYFRGKEKLVRRLEELWN